jgi:uncharacterized lipoprotein YmbA
MRAILLFCTVVTLGAGLLLLGGCAGQPTRFYILSPLPGTEAASPATSPGHGPAIGIGPVTLPRYLDRPQIVTRAGPYQLQLGEYDRWAEPLETNFSRAFAENLSLLMATDQVAIHPWPRGTPIDYQVSIEVAHFVGQRDGESVLVANWTLFRGEGQEALVSRKSRYSTPVAGEAYEAMVAAMSQTVADLSRDIASTIRELGPVASTLKTSPSRRATGRARP